jgi:hypothetical protein
LREKALDAAATGFAAGYQEKLIQPVDTEICATVSIVYMDSGSRAVAKYHAFAMILARQRLKGGVFYARVREAIGFFSLSVAVNPPDRSYAASVPPTEAAFLFSSFPWRRQAVTIAPARCRLPHPHSRPAISPVARSPAAGASG